MPEEEPSLVSSFDSRQEVEPRPWWETNFFLKDRLKNPPTEAYKLRLGDKELDLLNFDEALLTDEEKAQLVAALTAMAAFTKGKVFDRLIGVVLAGDESFRDENQDPSDRPSVSGDLNKLNPVVMLNLDAFRNPIDDSFPRFISERVREGISMMQFVFVHEVGHAMDLSYISEVERHGIDKDQANPDWEAYGDASKSFTAFSHPDPSVHTDERGLSERARSSSVEDFAETFAIAVLGGDLSAIPRKMQRLSETIDLANGEVSEGPFDIELQKAL